MDVKLIRKLAELMNAEGLKNIEITDGQLGIKIERDTAMNVIDENKITLLQKSGIGVNQSLPGRIILPKQTRPARSEPTQKSDPVPSSSKGVNYFEIRSPLVGKIHMAYNDNPPYVTIGSRVSKGDVLCIVETGRHLNEITSDVEGEIVEIRLKNGDKVGLDQIMFKVGPLRR